MTPQEVADYLIGDEVAFDQAALTHLEERAGTALPPDLRAFLGLRNGGATSPRAVEQEPLRFRGGHLIEHFYCVSGLDTDWSVTSIRNYKISTLRDWLVETDRDPTNVPAHYIVFGQNWGGDQWSIDLSVEGGEVVYLDHEMLPIDEHHVFPNHEGMTRLGVNFSQFLEGLEVAPPFEGPPVPAWEDKKPQGGFQRFLAKWLR